MTWDSRQCYQGSTVRGVAYDIGQGYRGSPVFALLMSTIMMRMMLMIDHDGGGDLNQHVVRCDVHVCEESRGSY